LIVECSVEAERFETRGLFRVRLHEWKPTSQNRDVGHPAEGRRFHEGRNPTQADRRLEWGTRLRAVL